jgi:ribosomal protein L24E
MGIWKRRRSWKNSYSIIKPRLCVVCGTKFYNEHMLSIGQRFCSKKCFTYYFRKDNHPNWLGGISKEPYDFEFNEELKRYIAERDKYTCQICNKQIDKGHTHHIHYIKKDSRAETLVFLDNSCHLKTNFNRDYWFAYFCKLKNIEPEVLINATT